MALKRASRLARKKLRVHFEDSIAKPDVFRLTAPRIAAARRRNPAAAAQLSLSHGEDFEELERWLTRAEGLVCSADFLLHARFPLRRLAQEAPQLRWIHTIGAGIEKLLPLDWIHPGLAFTNNSGVHRPKMYEFAVMALTMLNARVPALYSAQVARKWQPIFTPTCRGRRLLVVGTGDLGAVFARAGRHLGMHVTGLSRSARPAPGFDAVHPASRLRRLLPRTDIVVVAAPLTAQTRGLFDAAAMAALKPGAGLVNVGRGPIVDAAALADALRGNALSGAILDVFDQEPLPDSSPLWSVPNLYISPHCSSDDADEYIPRTLDLALDNARRLALGKPLRNVVDPRREY
jgi:phosphoglycerate dehydrogenase-like enzyme